MEPVRAHITVYGCQMNRLDGRLVADVLRADGACVVDVPGEANVLLYLTCSVRAHAEDRVFSNVGALAERKRAEPGLVIGILGCMAQQYGDGIRRRAPGVDLVCAPGRLAELPALLARARAGERVVALDPRRGEGGAEGFAGPDAALDRFGACRDASSDAPGRAFVRVMRGCDAFCAYCVVPHVRGPERSRAPGEVLEEVRRLAGQGVVQVTLLGQAVNAYAAEADGRRWDLADLVSGVAAVPGVERVQFITNHPRAMTPRLAAVLRDVPRVAPYLHMPAQSGSDAVLARMNRHYTAGEYVDRVAMVRAARPEVAVASDFIVGFPGETEADFESTLALVREVRFAGGFVFKYSPRPGTAAARRFEDDVPDEEKRRRHQVLLETVGRIAEEENRRFVGQRVEVFVEGPSPRPGLNRGGPGSADRPDWVQLRGRTPGNRIAVFDGPPDLAGRIVPVRLVEARAVTLFAEWDGPASDR